MSRAIKSVVLTGASGGLGIALAARLAAPGRHFLVMGRDMARLTQAQQAVHQAGATAELAQLDLRDFEKTRATVEDFDARHPIDLLIINAGVKAGNAAGIEPSAEFQRVIAVNLTATINLIQSALPAMERRQSGQIAIISSLAAISPHADLLSYSASKAGLAAYGTALRRALRQSGIDVSVVLPGFIDTVMTKRQRGPTPLLMSADTAAGIIVRGLARNKSKIAFPKLLIGLSWLMERLPAPLADRISDGFRADIDPDDDAPKP